MGKEGEGRDISVSQRQIYILSLLSENHKGYQTEEIRQRLLTWDIEVTRRTIQRDIDELSLNYGIVEEERDGKTYYSADKYTLKNVDLTIEDLASLAFAKEILKGYKHLKMGQHAMSFIDKVVDNSASLNKLQFEKLCGHFRQSESNGGIDNVDSEIEQMIQNAIDNRNKIEIDYYSFTSDESTIRIIHPYRLLMIDSYLNAEGFCELRSSIRRFRISRIKKVKVLDEHYSEEIPSESAPAFVSLVGDNQENIELVFRGESIRYVKEYETRRAKKLEDKEDGLHFYQSSAVTPDVIMWIRSFGADVLVVSPKWVDEQLKAEARIRLGGGSDKIL